jgi:hypothetical protein
MTLCLNYIMAKDYLKMTLVCSCNLKDFYRRGASYVIKDTKICQKQFSVAFELHAHRIHGITWFERRDLVW